MNHQMTTSRTMMTSATSTTNKKAILQDSFFYYQTIDFIFYKFTIVVQKNQNNNQYCIMNKNILILPITAHPHKNAQIYDEFSKQLHHHGFRNVSMQTFPSGSEFCLLPSSMSHKEILIVDASECTTSNIHLTLGYSALKTIYFLFPPEKSKEIKRIVHEHQTGCENVMSCQLIEWNGTKDKLSAIAQHIAAMECPLAKVEISQRLVTFIEMYFPEKKIKCLRELSKLTSDEWKAKLPKQRNEEERLFLFHNYGLQFKPEPENAPAG